MNQVQTQKVNVMLADASVTQQDTFEPQKVALFFGMLGRKLRSWSWQGIEKTDMDDLNRLHAQFTTSIDKYHLSCYLGIQYHALPFYKFDKTIMDIQKEIMELDEKAAKIRESTDSRENLALAEELKKRRISDLRFDEMLERMYNDQELTSELTQKVTEIEKLYPEYGQITKRRDELVSELKNMIIELYTIKPVLIDHNKLAQGEEGATIYFDLEMDNKGERSGNISIEKIPTITRKAIVDRMKEVEQALANMRE
ncbi:MAG: hypothetical protein ACE5J2_06335 [Nitrososphaerales archaeon]